MALIRLRDISLAFGPESLLDNAELVIESGNKIAILGRNGQGKSTLLKVIDGEQQADSGEIVISDGVTISRLQQEVPAGEDNRCVYDVAATGHDDQTATALQQLYAEGSTDIDTNIDIWRASAAIQSIVSRLQLQPDAKVSTLSGGQKRRVMLARALVSEPTVLLMDEPTNHLDVESVLWLEAFLIKLPITLIFVTHDRQLIKNLANRIVEIDRGTLTSWDQTYEKFLISREQAIAAQETQDKLFDKKLKQEEEWIRQGIKARRTRNEGRVRALKKLREERAQRRAQIGQVNMQVQTKTKSGRIVFKLDKITHTLGGKTLIRNFSATVMRGNKIAIIGPNGSGKTTLLKAILGQLTPDEGSVEHGSNLEIAYFDQLREQLDENRTAADNVSGGADYIEINGERKHIMGYMQEFLFNPERARAPIRALSGGERNRLLLARLFTMPSNVLVLDEPTNDLDVETLELLEYTVLHYQGTVLMVSHDREFIDNIATSTIVLDGKGNLTEYVGGYSDYLHQAGPPVESKKNDKQKKKQAKPAEQTKADKKLSYALQRELSSLPGKIEKLEAEKTELETQLADPEIYQGDATVLEKLQARYTSLDQEIGNFYTRWDELESQNS
ncbi:ABC transporter ATP-binding protein [Chromatiales bacterium (ex Bugula neritina AB1)]|nr:ABC transporter ATP-binding protein [Chromatiales bacterium (ex Bugula neritina AB1)]